MSMYNHSHIWINGRTVPIEDIENQNEKPRTVFESTTFDFMRSWLHGVESFELSTSGSTGDPKKIIVTREQMIASASLTERALSLKADSNSLVALDTRFIAGKMMIVRSFVTGMKMYAVDPSSDPLTNIPAGIIIDFTAMVPLQVQTIVESKHPQSLQQVKTCIIGGGPMNTFIEERLINYDGDFYQTYGMTETISHVALRKIGNERDVYHGLPDINLAQDPRGCLIITAPYLTGQIVTNDVVELFNSSSFKWVGRWDNIINSGGIKVSPETLEAEIGKLFTRINFKQPFFIYGLPDDRLGTRIVLVVQSPLMGDLSLQDAIRSLTHTISPYLIPKELYEVPAFSFTPTMKINRGETFRNARLIGSI
jgi:o-succinylbenzoate---CoA ligase